MNTRHVLARGFRLAAAVALAGAAGCRRAPERMDAGAPVVYEFVERMPHAIRTGPYRALDIGTPAARMFLAGAWSDEDRKTEDGQTSFAWISGRSAGASFFLASPADGHLVVRCYPYARRFWKQGMTAYVNGRKVGRVVFEPHRSFQEYRFAVPAEALAAGDNEVSLRFRYASTRLRRAACVDGLALEGSAGSPAPVPPGEAAGFTEAPPALRQLWPMVVPAGGYLKARARFDEASAGARARIYLGLKDRRLLLGEVSAAQPELPPIRLADYAGERAVLNVDVLGAGALRWEELAVGGRVRPRDVNILFITIDTLRADRVGAYGYTRHDTTPTLDRLAAAGVRFDAAFSCAYQSVPSHASMFTARYPQSHGLFRNGMYLNAQELTLAEWFDRAGYQTAAFVNWGMLGMTNMTGHGFARRVVNTQVPERPDLSPGADNVFARAADWLAANWKVRSFVWLHNQYLHMLSIPESYASRYLTPAVAEQAATDPSFRLPQRLPVDELTATRAAYNRGDLDLSEAEIQAVRDMYDGVVRMVDDSLAQFMDRLKALGLDPFTAVVICSDHGLSLGEDHRISHVGVPYDHILRIPLILILPGAGLAPGAVVGELVETVDLAPTLLDYLGEAAPRRMQGRSLLPVMRGGHDSWKDAVFAAGGHLERHWFSIRTGAWHYFFFDDGSEWLLPAGADGSALQSRAAGQPTVRDELRVKLIHWLKTTPSVVSYKETAMTEEIREMLRKAGYLDGSQ
jgi:arylsulfatase